METAVPTSGQGWETTHAGENEVRGDPRFPQDCLGQTLGKPRIYSFQMGIKRAGSPARGGATAGFTCFLPAPPFPGGGAPPPPGLGWETGGGCRAKQREVRGIRAASPRFHLPQRLGGQRRDQGKDKVPKLRSPEPGASRAAAGIGSGSVKVKPGKLSQERP